MALKNKPLLFLFILIALQTNVKAKIILSELLTKQSTNNIRFLSKDGKFTFYQKRSGSLLFSTNYKVKEILKSEIGTNYTLFASSHRKKIVILQNSTFHTFYSLRSLEKIYLVDFGETTPREIGSGIAPTLLLEDNWLSYYDPYSKILNFEHTTNAALKFSIKLNNRINPYFVPQVVMSDDNTVYYTDLNESGVPGILEFKRNLSKSESIYKASSAMMKIEICLNNNQLYLGEFGIHFSKKGSSISKAALPINDFSKKTNIYQSELNDLGHLVCDFSLDNIPFIKNTGSLNFPTYDITNLNTNDKQLTALSEMKTINNIINMDGTLLTQDKGVYYIVKGDADFKNTDSLKGKVDLNPVLNSDLPVIEKEKIDE